MTREEAIKIIYQEIQDTKIQGEKYAFLKKSCYKKCEAFDMAIKALEAWGKVEKDIHNEIDTALMYGYGDNYINACEIILKIIQKQEKCLKVSKTESEEV